MSIVASPSNMEFSVQSDTVISMQIKRPETSSTASRASYRSQYPLMAMLRQSYSNRSPSRMERRWKFGGASTKRSLAEVSKVSLKISTERNTTYSFPVERTWSHYIFKKIWVEVRIYYVENTLTCKLGRHPGKSFMEKRSINEAKTTQYILHPEGTRRWFFFE